ncbi:MAG: orotate phosphoribosyltransferase [Deltaproteobacteria bacterium]|nr:MAG: orotate phosphoribosyltransferase [Deltaproteobacteria bacterium]
MTYREELLELLYRLSYEERAVTLTSGKKSNYYVDGKQTSCHARGSFLVGQLFYERISAKAKAAGISIKGVGGLTMGADPIVSSISVVSVLHNDPLHAFLIRKEPKGHGKQLWIEGDKNFKPGDAVAIVEDVVTSGGSLLKAIERAQAHDLQVVQALTLVDRLEGGAELLREHGIEVEALFTIEDLKSFKG